MAIPAKNPHQKPWRVSVFYYPPGVARGEYWGLGVFLLHYSLVDPSTMMHSNCIKSEYRGKGGSKNMNQL